LKREVERASTEEGFDVPVVRRRNSLAKLTEELPFTAGPFEERATYTLGRC